MRTKGNVIYIISFLIIVLVAWLAFFAVPQPAIENLEKENGPVDLAEMDFSDTVFYYQDYWENYAEQLYTPQEFEDGSTVPPVHMEQADYEKYQYATHRMQMELAPGVTYAISMRTSDYAMRIFINGEEFDAVGNPGDTKESNVPRVAQRTYYFAPQESTVTIIAQTSNWVHKEGAYPPKFYIGTANNIERHNNHSQMMAFLIIGGLLTAFLYHLGLFMLNRKRKPVLIFALCCLLLMFMTNKLLPLFFPACAWDILFRMEYVIHFLTFAMLTLLVALLYPRLYHPLALRAYHILAGVFLLLTLVLTTELLSRLLLLFEGASVLMILYTLVRLGMRLREKRLKDMLAFAGIFMVCLFGINDILYQNSITFMGAIAGQRFTTPIAMMFFVFCYGLIIAIDYFETEQKMLAAESAVRKAEERYSALLENQANMPPFKTPADFKLSQRETDVLFLLLAGNSRQDIAGILGVSLGSINTYCSRIYGKTSCGSMVELFRLFGAPHAKKE